MTKGTTTAAASESAFSTQAQHTPGPWDWDFKSDHVRVWAGNWRDKSIVAEVPHADVLGRTPEIEANAHLIVAAPDMLEALRKAERALSLRTTYGTKAKPTVAELNVMLDDFRAAIAKAEGR